jgi:gamma-glutamyltranspeptidase/glutathione hydrolase
MLMLLLLIGIPILVANDIASGKNGSVVSASEIASDVGIEILKSGGNAIDAAIAVGFALAVTYPQAGNIGGGGFMLIRFPDGTVTAIDFREKAPLAAHRNMYLDSQGSPIDSLSQIGALSAGIPGSVAGFALAHQHYGTMIWKNLVIPAAKIAADGFPVTEDIYHTLTSYANRLRQFSASQKMFLPNNVVPQIGDTLRFPALARTLEKIAISGPQEFYSGSIARQIFQAVKEGGGIFSLEDLSQYTAVERTPIYFEYRGNDIYSMPPPSSGGICLAQILKIIENFSLGNLPFHGTQHVQFMVESERWAYANRAYFLGDFDFVDIPVDFLISTQLASSVASEINLERARPSTTVDHIQVPESEETTHFSVVDCDGIAVAVTTTLNDSYGSGFVAGETDILLNDEMDDFAVKPGYPNMYGLLGAEANAIEPGKRMLSSMTPTIIVRGDSILYVMGSPGGATIITTIAQLIVNLVDYQMGLDSAIQAPRFHHQWLPDEIVFEKGKFSATLFDSLSRKNYLVKERSSIGGVNAIEVQLRQRLYTGVGDERLQSSAKAY